MKKESTWNYCLESGSSRKISPDRAKAKSLIDIAKGRVRYLQEQEIRVENGNYVFEGYYASVLELLHAFLLQQGYTVNNHICSGLYLRDVLQQETLFRLFDDCRYKRNSLLYYGRKMDFETVKQAIAKSKRIIAELIALLEKT